MKREVAVVGVSTTEQVRGSPRYGLSFALEALRGALSDAGMEKREIEGLYVQCSDWPADPSAMNDGYYSNARWPYQLGIPIRWFTGAVNAAMTGAAAMLDAAAAISTGQIESAAMVLGRGRSQFGTEPGLPAPWAVATAPFTQWTGSFTAVQFALACRRHMHLYGTTREQLARVSATIRNYGHLNPDALMHDRGPYTVERVLNAPMTSDPLTRLMCAQVNDGGGALIMTSLERARDLKKKPIRVLGGGDQMSYPAYTEPPLLEHPSGEAYSRQWADDGFARAGVSRDDIDVVELYDGFASWIIMQWEMLGFCKPGEGGPFVESGVMELDGRYPTCTDGGCQAFSHNGTPSLFRPIEAVRQLRGEVADACPGWAHGEHTYEKGVCRAVRDPKIALAMSMGPPTGGGNFVVLARD